MVTVSFFYVKKQRFVSRAVTAVGRHVDDFKVVSWLRVKFPVSWAPCRDQFKIDSHGFGIQDPYVRAPCRLKVQSHGPIENQ